jgi:hypothetical protein
MIGVKRFAGFLIDSSASLGMTLLRPAGYEGQAYVVYRKGDKPVRVAGEEGVRSGFWQEGGFWAGLV